MRIRAFPFHGSVEAFLAAHDRVFVVEQNRDAQLKSMLVNETDCPKEKLVSVLHYDGMPLRAAELVDAISQHEQESAAA